VIHRIASMITRQIAAVVFALAFLCAPARAQEQSFAAFVNELWPDAQAKGITRANFDLAMRGVTPDARVIAATKRQPEYGKPVGAYINDIVSIGRIKRGAVKAQEWAKIFDAVEKKFQVERSVLVALWGMESDYGAAKDKWDVFRSLSTLAYVKYRHPYFRNELIVAMGIMQRSGFKREQMVSSWAGAMGQTQFMPSSFFSYAVDFSGDGRRDIWANVPDVLASIANYMQKSGWQAGMPWGIEVVVPKGFDYKGPSRGSFAEWKARGFSRTRGAAFPEKGDAILFFPSGAAGPAFLVTDNFTVIKRFNNSDAYALAIAHLADRMRGGAPIEATWPPNDFQPSRDERIALQRKLAELGYKVRNLTGHLDFDLRDALREQEKKYGMIPDGYPSRALLDRIGVRTP
jgi:membrane-bound lytic murein transglycosylase B